MNLPLFIARRLYAENRGEKTVSRPAVVIAVSGMAIGLAIMIISLCVALGFKQQIQEKLVGFASPIQVQNMEQTSSAETYPIATGDSLQNMLGHLDGVCHVQRYITKPSMLKTDKDFRGVVLKGLGAEYDLTFLKHYLLEGEFPAFSDTVASGQILISRKLADELQVQVGDKLYFYFMGNTIRARRYQVSGIYATHLMEFDNTMVYTDLYALRKLNRWEPDQVSGLEVQLTDFNRLEAVYPQFVRRVNGQVDRFGDTYYASTVKMAYPSMFSWLSLLDMNVWVILILLLAVSGFLTVSSLLILILERTQMIGLLKALGETDTAIRHIFLYFAVFILGKGMVWGNVLGLGLCFLQQQFGLIPLDADTYYVDTVPILFHPLYLLLLNVGTAVVSVGVLILPTYLVSHIQPARAIRFE